METIGYIIKNTTDMWHHGSFYRTEGVARNIAARFNNSLFYDNDYEVFEIVGIKKVEK